MSKEAVLDVGANRQLYTCPRSRSGDAFASVNESSALPSGVSGEKSDSGSPGSDSPPALRRDARGVARRAGGGVQSPRRRRPIEAAPTRSAPCPRPASRQLCHRRQLCRRPGAAGGTRGGSPRESRRRQTESLPTRRPRSVKRASSASRVASTPGSARTAGPRPSTLPLPTPRSRTPTTRPRVR